VALRYLFLPQVPNPQYQSHGATGGMYPPNRDTKISQQDQDTWMKLGLVSACLCVAGRAGGRRSEEALSGPHQGVPG
jgi:hypothetical protein